MEKLYSRMRSYFYGVKVGLWTEDNALEWKAILSKIQRKSNSKKNRYSRTEVWKIKN